MGLCEKVIAPKPNNLLCQHGSKSCNQVFGITGSESFIWLWRNFGPLFFSKNVFKLATLEGLCMASLFEIMPKHPKSGL